VSAERAAGILQEARVLDRCGADDDVLQPRVQVQLDRGQIADAATELHRDLAADGLEDGLDGRAILRLTGKCAIQIHQMQTPGPGIEPLPRHGSRVFAKGGGLFHVALLEAYAVTVLEVDGRDEQHGRGMTAGSGVDRPG